MEKISRILWWCAGARPDILKDCPTDHAKYFGIGGTIVFTALMAGFAGGYAFNTAFDSIILSVFFGIFWGFLIFNLDRYIVSTIGKGDGTQKITREEWKSAAPRLLMAIILGIVISTPLELKLFEKEINVEVEKMIGEERDRLRINENPNIQEIAQVKQEIAALKDEQDKKDKESIKPLENTLEDEEIEKKKGELPAIEQAIRDANKKYSEAKRELEYDEENENIRKKANRYSAQKNALNKTKNNLLNEIKLLRDSKHSLSMDKRKEVKELKEDNKIKIEALEKKLANLEATHSDERKNHDEVAKQFNGLMAKLEALGRLSSDHITLGMAKWLITSLLIFIEVAPVLFKLMTESGPYDDIIDRMKHERNVAEKQRISDLNDKINTDIIISSEKNKVRLDAELQGNKALLECIALSQAEIANKAVGKWKESELKKLEQSVSHIIKPNISSSPIFEDKFWSYKTASDELIFCFKNSASKEVWLKNNDQLTVGNWNKINENQIEIKTDSSVRLYNIEEITNDTLRICELGTNNKINLTLS
jgi:hypothetical protein